jgi:hypothetical protein
VILHENSLAFSFTSIHAVGPHVVTLHSPIAVLVVGHSDTALAFMPALHSSGRAGAVNRYHSCRNITGCWLAVRGHSSGSSRQRWQQHAAAAETDMSTTGASGITGDTYTVSDAEKFFEDNG